MQLRQRAVLAGLAGLRRAAVYGVAPDGSGQQLHGGP